MSTPLWADGPLVTFLGYGAMELRGGADVHRRPRPLARDLAHQVLHAVLDEGITFIDTSIDYGLSEELIGEAIISTVIAGSANPDHVRSNARAVRRGPLAKDVSTEAWRRISDAGFVAPGSLAGESR